MLKRFKDLKEGLIKLTKMKKLFNIKDILSREEKNKILMMLKFFLLKV